MHNNYILLKIKDNQNNTDSLYFSLLYKNMNVHMYKVPENHVFLHQSIMITSQRINLKLDYYILRFITESFPFNKLQKFEK